MTSHPTHRTLRALLAAAILLPVLLAAAAALADDDQRLQEAREALNERSYRRAAELYARAREHAEQERTRAEALYWEAFARYRTDRTGELEEALELLQFHAQHYAEAATAAEAEALQARVVGELARRGRADAAREVYQLSEQERQKEETRIAALHALMQMDADKALPILEKIVRNDGETSRDLRQSALFMLCQTGDEGVDILLDVLPTLRDPDMIQTAVICLGQSDSERAGDALVDLARNSEDPEVLQAAMIALGHSERAEAAFDLMAEIARDKARDPEVRSHAIIGLMQAEVPGTTDVLLDIINDRDQDEEILETALMALAHLDDDVATDVLLDMATNEDLDDELRAQAVFMAGAQGHVAPARLKEIYDATGSRDLKAQICHVLAQHDDEDAAFDVMMDILEHEEDPDVRSEAVFWVGQFDDPRAAEYLLKVINEE